MRFLDVYDSGFEVSHEELEAAIAEARDQHNVRVFNMSLHITSPVEHNLYSICAGRLYEIQERQDVIIVNSACTLSATEWRATWLRTAR